MGLGLSHRLGGFRLSSHPSVAAVFSRRGGAGGAAGVRRGGAGAAAPRDVPRLAPRGPSPPPPRPHTHTQTAPQKTTTEVPPPPLLACDPETYPAWRREVPPPTHTHAHTQRPTTTTTHTHTHLPLAARPRPRDYFFWRREAAPFHTSTPAPPPHTHPSRAAAPGDVPRLAPRGPSHTYAASPPLPPPQPRVPPSLPHKRREPPQTTTSPAHAFHRLLACVPETYPARCSEAGPPPPHTHNSSACLASARVLNCEAPRDVFRLAPRGSPPSLPPAHAPSPAHPHKAPQPPPSPPQIHVPVVACPRP